VEARESNPRLKSATTRSLHAYLNSVCDACFTRRSWKQENGTEEIQMQIQKPHTSNRRVGLLKSQAPYKIKMPRNAIEL